MPRILIITACLAISAMTSGVGWGQQVQPSCEEQLANAQTTLMFTRAGRQGTEENAGRVATTLQRQLEALQHELDALKKAQTTVSSPASELSMPQKAAP